METHDVPIRVDHIGIAVESISDAEPVLLALGCDRSTDEIVDRATFDGWREAFVSPRNPTGVLFQLMQYTDDYPETQGVPSDDLSVGSQRIDTPQQRITTERLKNNLYTVDTDTRVTC